MLVMHKTAFAMALALFAVLAGSACAQIYPPGGINNQPVIPFPTAPPAPPPPPIVVPKVPQMNSPPPFALQNTTPGRVTQDTPPEPVLRRERRRSFSDRVPHGLQRQPSKRALAGAARCPQSSH